MSAEENGRENWSSGMGFILAAAGSAIGLGNIWKFPYVTGENGGGAFVLVYLLCVAIIGVPVLLCEMTLGRHTQRNPVGAFKVLSPAKSHLATLVALLVLLGGCCMLAFRAWGWGAVALVIGGLIFRYRWRVVGAMGVLAGFVILSYYSVVAGWTISYIFKSLAGKIAFDSVAEAKSQFESFLINPWYAVGAHLLFMAMCVSIVYHGIQGGIERWSKILMPLLLLILVALILRGITLPGALEGVRFYLSPDFSKITPRSVLMALGLAFFSLSLGMGCIMTYGSYVSHKENLFIATLAVAGLDTLASLLAGLAIFPALFAMQFEPDLGPGLVFKVLPALFSQMPLGSFWAVLFFTLLLVAALTSGISLLEVVTAYFIDERGWKRQRAAVVFGAAIALLGCGSALSVAGWQRFPVFEKSLIRLFGSAPASFFDMMDQFASNWLLPLGGLFMALFVGWVWGTSHALKELRHGADNFGDVNLGKLLAGLRDEPSASGVPTGVTFGILWGIFIRFIAPTGIAVAFLHAIGWLDF